MRLCSGFYGSIVLVSWMGPSAAQVMFNESGVLSRGLCDGVVIRWLVLWG